MSLEEVKGAARAAPPSCWTSTGRCRPSSSGPRKRCRSPAREEVLAGLVERAGDVTIVTGRRSGFIRSVLSGRGPRCDRAVRDGRIPRPCRTEVLAEVNAAVAGESGVRVVDKSASIAVHVRTHARPRCGDRQGSRGRSPRSPSGTDWRSCPGSACWSSSGRGAAKGIVVEEVVARTGAEAALYAGDDLNDVPAFDALEVLAEGRRADLS